jgi:glycosyltransferase involved in cell wall biosynthesis
VHGELVFAISADYEKRTGGWTYDQRLMSELRQRGWLVRDLILPAGFPEPSEEALFLSAAALDALADGTLVVMDQLCLGVMPELARRHSARLRLVMIVHHPLFMDHEEIQKKRSSFARLEGEVFRHVALAIVTSHTTERYLRENFNLSREHMVVAVPGVDLKPIAHGSGDHKLSLLSVGAMVPRKNQRALIAALSALIDENWQLNLVGNITRAPSYVESVRAQIANSGLAGRVQLSGELSDVALESAWGRADVYVASSRHEGFGMAFAEALAHGLPIVTTDAGAVGDWISRDAAIVVPTGDDESLRAGLARIIREPDIRGALRRGALKKRGLLPRWRQTADRVEAALSRLMNRETCI